MDSLLTTAIVELGGIDLHRSEKVVRLRMRRPLCAGRSLPLLQSKMGSMQ